MLNLAQLRADTPGVDHRLHPNNAGASLMPRSVLDVMQEYLARESEIGGYETADERQDVIAASYDEIAGLIGSKLLNACLFHVRSSRYVMEGSGGPPQSARINAILSLVLWGFVVVAGRLIAYV